MQTHGDKAIRFAYVSMTRKAEAEDVAQEGFIRLWRHAERHGVETLSPALLFHTLTNLCRDRARFHHRHPEDPVETMEIYRGQVFEGPSMEDDEAIFRSVMQLNVLERQCILLFYYMDRSLKDIAKILNVNEQVVKTRLYRARQHLRPLLVAIWEEGLS